MKYFKYTGYTYFITLLLILIIYSLIGYSQTKPSTNKVKTPRSIPLDPDVKIGQLANGFTYYIRKNATPKNRAQLYLANKVGSILEDENQQGLAHFIEHMSFNGTKNYPKNELINYLQKVGVNSQADLNAYTNYDETVYQLFIPTDDTEVLKNGIQIMRDWAQDVTLDSIEIDKERGVILEEKRLHKNANERMRAQYLPILLNNSRYANRLPIGTEEVLKNFKPITLRQFYKDWYRPNLQGLIIVGDIDVNAVEQIIKAQFSDLKNPSKLPPRTNYTIPLLDKNQFIAITDKEATTTEAHIFIKHPKMVIKTKTDLTNSVIRSLYNSMLGTRFGEIMMESTPPFLNGGSDMDEFLAGLDYEHSFTVAKPDSLEKGFKAVLTEVERVKRFGFTQTELTQAKNAFLVQMEAAYKERSKADSRGLADEYLQNFLEQSISLSPKYRYHFHKKIIKNISLAKTNKITKKYISDFNRDIIILGLEKDKDELPNEATINRWIKDVKESKIAPYIHRIPNKPLLTHKPRTGKIINEKHDPDLDLTELTLSNKVKVILKQTYFTNDGIHMSIFSPGGSSLYSDADFQSAENAANIMAQSGIGEFNSIDLSKFLSDKRISIQPYIAESSEGFDGYASSADLETALKLIYLCFTQPHKDEKSFKNYTTQWKESLANRANDPINIFRDSVNALINNHHIRYSAPSIEKINQINLDRAYDIFKERFADASDFTFIFVGSFDLKKTKVLVEKYLAGLPSLFRKEEAKDLGIRTPTGKITKNFYKGQEDKAKVVLFFSGENHIYNLENNNQLYALLRLLNLKLTERLREEESGVYGVNVYGNYFKYLQSRYRIDIDFDCSPENVEKLILATLDEINKIKQNGAQNSDIQKYFAEEKNGLELRLKDNNFWLSYLSTQFSNNEDPRIILTYLDSLKMISSESLKVAANKYFKGDNLIQYILLPEKDKFSRESTDSDPKPIID